MPASQHRLPRSSADGCLSWRWWPKLSTREWTIVTALSLFILILSPFPTWHSFTKTDTNSETTSAWVPFTPSSKAQENSACKISSLIYIYVYQENWNSSWFYTSFQFQIDSFWNNCSLFGWECAWVSFKEGFWIWLWQLAYSHWGFQFTGLLSIIVSTMLWSIRIFLAGDILA